MMSVWKLKRNPLVIISQLRKISSERNSPCNAMLKSKTPITNVIRQVRTSCNYHQEIKDDFRLTNFVEKTVNSYGYLEICNLDLDVSIKPTCPDKYPDMNKAICKFYSKIEDTPPQLIHEDEKLSIKGNKVYQSKESHCSIEIPMKYHVDSSNILGQNSVKVESLESPSIRITTGTGDITSKSIKGDFISLLSQTGNVNCLGLSQGRITIHSGSGDIHGYKFQGPTLKVATNSGNITAESVYSDESQFVSATGNITLKNLHRKCSVKITSTGNLNASGMDGSLDAQLGQGQHQIQISQLQEDSCVRIVNGSLTLKVPEDCAFGIRVVARSIAITPEKMRIGHLITTDDSCFFEYRTHDDGHSTIEIEGKNSNVVIENEDWFASLGLEWQK